MIFSRRRAEKRPETSFYWRGIFVLAALGFLLFQIDAHAQEPFDHFSTGFVLDGAHTNVTCEGCHVSGAFSATNPSCSSCHSDSGLVRASAKPASHVLTTGECSDCHVTANWTVIAFMDHSSITGSCVTCHNGIQSTGKTIDHISVQRPVRRLVTARQPGYRLSSIIRALSATALGAMTALVRPARI